MAGRGTLVDALRERFDVELADVPAGVRHIRIAHPRSAEDLIDEAAFERDERLPYWADIWPSSIVLASHLVSMNGEGRRLLELGCGVGLVSTAAAIVGFEVTATDYYEDALAFTRANARLNGVRTPETRLVDWRALPAALGPFDVVVASDVLYERPYAALVAEALAATLSPTGVAVLADPGRVATPTFLREGERRGLAIDLGARVPYVNGDIRQTIDLYDIRVAARPRAGG